jgi:drug/metabolite transporter (DMT)-like permease
MNLWRRIESIPASETRARLIGIGLMCLVAFSSAIIEFFGSLIPSAYSPYQTVWARYATHLLFMLVVLGRTEGRRMVATGRLRDHVFRSLLMLGMPFCFITAIRHGLNPAFVWSVTWITSPMLMVMSVIVLRERVSRVQWIAALTGLAGTWLVIKPSTPALRWALILPVGVAFCYAFYCLLTREMRTEHTSTNLFHTALWVFVALTFVMPFVWHTPPPKIALITTAIGVWGFVVLLLLDRALALAPVSLTAPFLYTQCLWSAAMLSFSHSFYFRVPALIGSVLIVGSCVWILMHERVNVAVKEDSPVAAARS